MNCALRSSKANPDTVHRIYRANFLPACPGQSAVISFNQPNTSASNPISHDHDDRDHIGRKSCICLKMMRSTVNSLTMSRKGGRTFAGSLGSQRANLSTSLSPAFISDRFPVPTILALPTEGHSNQTARGAGIDKSRVMNSFERLKIGDVDWTLANMSRHPWAAHTCAVCVSSSTFDPSAIRKTTSNWQK
jgi:hypothetical protein